MTHRGGRMPGSSLEHAQSSAFEAFNVIESSVTASFDDPPKEIGVAFIEEGDPRAKEGVPHALAVSAVCLSKRSLSIGVAQASDTLTVPV